MNRQFLETLRNKLKSGNLRSIHLNALPSRYATRLDLSNFDYVKPDFAKEFLNQILTKSCFEFKISFDGINLNSIKPEEQKNLALLAKRLNSIAIENEDNYKEHGIKTFGFGYPLLIKPSKNDPQKIIKAPLFIWQLEIAKATNKVNTWSILRNKTRNEEGKIKDNEVHSVALNEVLISFIKTDENIDIPQINEDLLEDAIIDKRELVEECERVLKTLNTNVNITELEKGFNEPLTNIPDAKKLESITNQNGWIYFGGVFGLFRTQKESIVTDIDKLIEKYNEFDWENLKIEKFSGTAYSAIETDPSQQEILATLGTETKKIIQGPPGTGKSQSLTAIIVNALANNLKCLVVCEKKTALDVIKNNLHRENEQIGSLAAVIEDINKDRDAIVNSVRNRFDTKQSPNFNKTEYNNIIQKIDQTVKEINEQHKLLDKEIYKDKSWTKLVGEFLKLQRIYDCPKDIFDYKQFKFKNDESELDNFIDKIGKARKLYAELNTLDHPLEILNSAIFKQNSPKIIQFDLKKFCKEMHNKISNIKSILQNQVIDYNNWLNDHYENYYCELKTKIEDYLSFVEKNNSIYGKIFYQNDTFSKIRINLLKLFSEKYEKLKQARECIIENVSEIRKTHLHQNYIEHNYIEEKHKTNTLHIYVENINELEHSAKIWYEQNAIVKENYKNNLSARTMHPKYELDKKGIIDIEKQYENIISYFNNEKLFKITCRNTINHKEKISEIECIIANLNTVLQNLEYFIDFFNWKKFYTELSPLEQTVIKSLIKLNYKDWENTFKIWYYYWLISFEENDRLPRNDDKILELIKIKKSLKENQIKCIVSNWISRQLKSMKESEDIYIKNLYNKRGTKGERRNSLRKIIKTNFNLFTDFFPIVMLSPTVCSSIIPLQEKIFDIVIFDESSQLRLEDSFSALIRGKIKIISGDSQQMPPSNFFQGSSILINPTEDEDNFEEDEENQIEKQNNSIDLANSESLLVYAENCNYKQSYLDVHYRSQHPDLIQFSNNAFYEGRLIPMPAKKEYTPIHFIEVNGLYQDQVNEDEARKVIDILLNVQPLENGKYPSVGVATFNLFQRNLILEEITKCRQKKSEYDKKISDLEIAGLFVKNLENIQGDERDMIIISTTFGKNKDNSFRQNFGPIIQSNGYKLLNVIITRAKHEIFVCTSIPQGYYNLYANLLKQKKNNGRAIFYAYLVYSKAVSENNTEIKKSLLKLLHENNSSKSSTLIEPSGDSESPFEEEVYCMLAEKIGQERLEQQYKIGGFRIDIIIKSEQNDKPIIAIECDGAKYHSSNEAYAWDMFRQSQLEKHGLIFYRIWSTNWWYSPEKELEKLIAFISRNS
jgi:superfamily I DNA and/or RNA helicase/very-short-patch-repair endonuclease